ncbi:hypothetical protein K491DRAFT_722455 [Lophiostoma macrostomum CBS 122681]|uniref:Uncharacterized protein n=1 Tax=Lophiostoma macrostomum CBS 122681 TaxID=1314788 RepID=A0A6A6SL04_9PLEO|nr:hypothetical protein K491DRAFT_722455 [Lophiostoma macrostomum CBS 122681]
MATTDKDAITARNSLESPLLRLPGEIRDKIYKYAIGGNIIKFSRVNSGRTGTRKTVVSCFDDFFTIPSFSPGPPFKQLLSLGLVCRQTASETQGLPLATNILGFLGLWELGSVLSSISNDKRNHIIDIVIIDAMLMGIQPFKDFSMTHQLPATTVLMPSLKRIFVIKQVDHEGQSLWGRRWENIPLEAAAKEIFGIGDGQRESCKIVIIDS